MVKGLILTAGILVMMSATANDYPAMAPFGQYASSDEAAEIALARSAAPAAISGAAEILVLDAQGYHRAAAGSNGFTCLVERAWNDGLDDPQFWNPKIRAPNCYNAAAARSVLPVYLKRTEWALHGVSAAGIKDKLRQAAAAKAIAPPEAGAMSYMMSKDSYLSDAEGHAHPHMMFYLPPSEPGIWGANVKGSPIFADQGAPEPLTIFFISTLSWSDGSPASGHQN